MKIPPQYSHLCSRTFSCDVGLGCCRAYLLLHLSEQKIRRRPCPLRAGMALPQFGHRPITLMLPISASSTISHLDMVEDALIGSIKVIGLSVRPQPYLTSICFLIQGCFESHFQAIVRKKAAKQRFRIISPQKRVDLNMSSPALFGPVETPKMLGPARLFDYLRCISRTVSKGS